MKISFNNIFLLFIGGLLLCPCVISSSPVILSPESDDQDISSLTIGDNMVCNGDLCYPKLFEPTDEWQVIKPAQVLPGGLDIRVNMETGLKEAKLVANIPNKEEFGQSKELDVVPSSEGDKEVETGFEFSDDFKTVHAQIDKANNLETGGDMLLVQTKLDDLMEFAHDYKHGYKIIKHEIALLESIASNEDLVLTVRELAIRMINSCLRNNPPAIAYIEEEHPDFIMRVFENLHGLAKKSTSQTATILIKRYLSTLIELLPSAFEITLKEFDTLEQLLRLEDKQIRIKTLELASKYFTSSRIQETEKIVKQSSLLSWAKEFETIIQDKDIDELHTRKFFDSLYDIKQLVNTDAKVGTDFLKWLEDQADYRHQNLNRDLEHRDLEQDSFDKKLIESRHLIFGNPMAHRIKYFEDEL